MERNPPLPAKKVTPKDDLKNADAAFSESCSKERGCGKTLSVSATECSTHHYGEVMT